MIINASLVVFGSRMSVFYYLQGWLDIRFVYYIEFMEILILKELEIKKMSILVTKYPVRYQAQNLSELSQTLLIVALKNP